MPNWLLHLYTLMYIPSTKILDKISGKRVSTYWGSGGSNGSAERNVIRFYYGLQPYMKQVYPIGGVMREAITWIVSLLYQLDMFLEALYIHMFDILGLGSETTLHSGSPEGHAIALWYQWGQAAGLVFLTIAVMIYFLRIILSSNATLLQQTKHGFWTMIVVVGVIAGAPWVTGRVTEGIGAFAQDAFHAQDVTSGSMIEDAFYDHVYSIPHLLMDKSAGTEITTNGDGTQKLGGDHIRFVPGTEMSDSVDAKNMIVNLQGMDTQSPNGQNRWNGLHETSIPNFLQNYASDDDVLDQHGLNDLTGSQSSKKANKKHKKITKAKAKWLKKEGKDHQAKIAEANKEKSDSDEFHDSGIHWIKGLESKTTDPLHKWADESEENTDSSEAKQNAKNKVDGYTQEAIPMPTQYTDKENELLSYKLAGSGDDTRLVSINMANDSMHAVHQFYAMYKVDWADIILQLLLIAWVFTAFIIKIVRTEFKSVVMYSTLGIVAYKGFTDPQKYKQYIRNYFNLFEMLVFDIIFIIMWFNCSRFVNAFITDFTFHMAVPNDIVSGIVQAVCDFALAQVAIQGIQRISDLIGAPSGGSNGWSSALGSMMALRTGLGVAGGAMRTGSNALHHVGNGARRVGHGAHNMGTAAHNALDKSKMAHGGKGPLTRAKDKIKARRARKKQNGMLTHGPSHEAPASAHERNRKRNQAAADKQKLRLKGGSSNGTKGDNSKGTQKGTNSNPTQGGKPVDKQHKGSHFNNSANKNLGETPTSSGDNSETPASGSDTSTPTSAGSNVQNNDVLNDTSNPSNGNGNGVNSGASFDVSNPTNGDTEDTNNQSTQDSADSNPTSSTGSGSASSNGQNGNAQDTSNPTKANGAERSQQKGRLGGANGTKSNYNGHQLTHDNNDPTQQNAATENQDQNGTTGDLPHDSGNDSTPSGTGTGVGTTGNGSSTTPQDSTAPGKRKDVNVDTGNNGNGASSIQNEKDRVVRHLHDNGNGQGVIDRHRNVHVSTVHDGGNDTSSPLVNDTTTTTSDGDTSSNHLNQPNISSYNNSYTPTHLAQGQNDNGNPINQDVSQNNTQDEYVPGNDGAGSTTTQHLNNNVIQHVSSDGTTDTVNRVINNNLSKQQDDNGYAKTPHFNTTENDNITHKKGNLSNGKGTGINFANLVNKKHHNN